MQVDYWGRLLSAQGRGQNTYAFTHALETGHHMFMKLVDGRVYCLPEGYEVDDRSLDAIRYVLNPTFTSAQARSYCVCACVRVCDLISERRLCQMSGGRLARAPRACADGSSLGRQESDTCSRTPLMRTTLPCISQICFCFIACMQVAGAAGIEG